MKKFCAVVLAITLIMSCCCAVCCNIDKRVKVNLYYFDESGTPMQVVYNSKADLPTPRRDGYNFEGWYYDEQFQRPFEKGTEMSQSFNLYAKWVKVDDVRHTVTLIFGDGRPDEQLVVKDGEQAPLPQAERQNFRFDGWWTAENGGMQWSAQPVTEDMTLYAHWHSLSVVTHIVTLVFNDGTTSDKQISVVHGDSASKQLPTPSREEFNFDGWYLNSNCTVAYSNQAITQDITLYARWKSFDSSEILPIRIELTAVSDTVEEGSTLAVTVTVYPDNTTDQTVNWSSSDTSVATIENGVISAISPGTTTITARSVSDPACSDSLTITVTAKSKEHTQHDFGENYFMYVKCSYEDCDVVGRNVGVRLYDNMLTYDNNRAQIIYQHYSDCIRASKTNAAEFIAALNVYEQDINYLSNQYYWVSVYSGTELYNESTSGMVIQGYDLHFSYFYSLFIIADQSFGENFWSTYGADRDSVLYWAEIYAQPNRDSEVNSILDDYSRAIRTNAGYTSYDTLYAKLVNAYNKEAAVYGYDSYIEYAYRNVYNREYGPLDTEQMHRDIKEYIAPALVKVNRELESMKRGLSIAFSNSANRNFYNTLTNGAIINGPSQDATNYIGNYFKWLNDNTSTKPIDFFSAVNDMFKNGAYFTGYSEGAFTLYAPLDEVAGVYIMHDYRYDIPFTFVHEFGHYYNHILNGGIALSYDHDETQSQGNEMLFLAWLKSTKPDEITDGMRALELSQLENILHTICMAAAVDELEQAAYLGTYQGQAITGNYHSLFGKILDSYGSEASALLKANGNQSYWYYVAFTNAVYYISYAMSALPCVELYTIAETQSVEAARDTYFKLFTYCEDQDRMNNYAYTGENGVLRYSGLDSPFDTELYLRIDAYVDELCPDN